MPRLAGAPFAEADFALPSLDLFLRRLPSVAAVAVVEVAVPVALVAVAA